MQVLSEGNGVSIAIASIGELLVEFEEPADPACHISFILRIAYRPNTSHHRAQKSFDFGRIAANFVLRRADASPGQAIVAADIDENAVAFSQSSEIVGRRYQRGIDQALFERGNARWIGAAGKNRDVFFGP